MLSLEKRIPARSGAANNIFLMVSQDMFVTDDVRTPKIACTCFVSNVTGVAETHADGDII